MGNTIANPNGEMHDIKLNKYIQEWALNDYNNGLSIDNISKVRFKNLLKKRACCTKQTRIPIAIPSVNNNGEIEYSSVFIQVFPSIKDITPEACTFEPVIINGIERNKIYYHKDSNGFIISDINCDPIYRGLCDKVKKDRSRYNGDIERLYGPYPDSKVEKIGETNNKENQYIDCNCKNSIYFTDIINVSANSQNINPDSLAQTLDSRCALNLASTFKLSDNRIQDLCLNTINIAGNITPEDQSKIGLNQTCSKSNTINQQELTPEQKAQLNASIELNARLENVLKNLESQSSPLINISLGTPSPPAPAPVVAAPVVVAVPAPTSTPVPAPSASPLHTSINIVAANSKPNISNKIIYIIVGVIAFILLIGGGIIYLSMVKLKK
jgi:hypothetical protein